MQKKFRNKSMQILKNYNFKIMKVGDKVKIQSSFTYAGDSDSNPIDTVGIIKRVDDSGLTDFRFHVEWSNSTNNSYRFDDLELQKIDVDTKEQSKPEHYKTDSIDVIDFCKLYDLNFNRGNIVKYVSRAGKKDDEIADLKKAMDYLQREIKFLETNK